MVDLALENQEKDLDLGHFSVDPNLESVPEKEEDDAMKMKKKEVSSLGLFLSAYLFPLFG